jgi:hypothetical protein
MQDHRAWRGVGEDADVHAVRVVVECGGVVRLGGRPQRAQVVHGQPVGVWGCEIGGVQGALFGEHLLVDGHELLVERYGARRNTGAGGVRTGWAVMIGPLGDVEFGLRRAGCQPQRGCVSGSMPRESFATTSWVSAELAGWMRPRRASRKSNSMRLR